MEVQVLDSFNTLEMEISGKTEVSSTLTKEQIKQDLETAAVALSRFCASELANGISSMKIKEIKDLSRMIIDIQRAFFGNEGVTINNIQQNISNTQLNFFKQSLKNEI